MDGSGSTPIAKIVPYVLAVVIGGAGVGYAVHEHHNAQIETQQAQTLAAQNAQVTSQMNATNSQMNVLAAKVNELEDRDAKPSPSAPVSEAAKARALKARRAEDARLNKLQTQLDAQGNAIAQTQTDLTSTQNDLNTTSTQLNGSIARTHDELVNLEKRGQRNYFEFDLQKSKDFKREGPMSVSLRKANAKHGYADLMLIVDDRNLTQKHVNLYQPVMFYQPGGEQPVEVVINDITKDHIHGYISAPKYQPSELAAASASADASGNAQPAQRQKLTLTPSDTAQQGNDNGPVTAQPNQQ